MHVTIASKNKFFISIDNFLDHIKKYILCGLAKLSINLKIYISRV